MKDRSTTGRTPWDVLSEILSSSGSWLIPVMLVIAIAAVAWVHYQTPPGGSVKIFGISLYNRTPERAIPEQKPNVDISAPPLDKPKFDKESGHLDDWTKRGREADSYEVGIDDKFYHTAPRSYYIRSVSAALSDKVNGTLIQKLDASDYKGKRVRLSAFVKSVYQKKKGNTSYLFVAGHAPNEIYRWINGDLDWHRVSLVFDVSDSSRSFQYGVSLWGKGIIWLDDVKFEVVDKSVALNPALEVKQPTNLP